MQLGSTSWECRLLAVRPEGADHQWRRVPHGRYNECSGGQTVARKTYRSKSRSGLRYHQHLPNHIPPLERLLQQHRHLADHPASLPSGLLFSRQQTFERQGSTIRLRRAMANPITG